MEYLWMLLVVTTLVVYPVVLMRSAVKGKRWALETLEAMRFLGGDMMTTSVWRSLPPEPAPPVEAQTREEEERGRLVA
jgi:hypothetical protein